MDNKALSKEIILGDVPNRAFISLKLTEDVSDDKNEFVGMYLLEYGNEDTFLYKHEKNEYYIFHDFLGLILVDKKPNSSLDNYNVLYTENKDNNQFIPNNYFNGKKLSILDNTKFKMCLGELNSGENSSFGYNREQKEIDIDFKNVDDIDLHELLITYNRHCYFLPDVLEFYSKHSIEENIDFNYEGGFRFYMDKKDLEERVLKHPWILNHVSKMNTYVINFVNKCNQYISSIDIKDLVKKNISFIKQIGQWGIFAQSDHHSDQSDTKQEFEYTNLFKSELFVNATEEQRLLLSNDIFLYNNKTIFDHLNTGDCVHGLGFIACYIYLKIFVKSQEWGFSKELEMNNLFINIGNDLYISFHIIGNYSNDLILINDNIPNKEFEFSVTWYNIVNKDIGYTTSFGRGDINQSIDYILSYLISTGDNLRDIFINYLRSNKINENTYIGPVTTYLLGKTEVNKKEVNNIDFVMEKFVDGIKDLIADYQSLVKSPESISDNIKNVEDIILDIVLQNKFNIKNENVIKYLNITNNKLDGDERYYSSIFATQDVEEDLEYLMFLILRTYKTKIIISGQNNLHRELVKNILSYNDKRSIYYIIKLYYEQLLEPHYSNDVLVTLITQLKSYLFTIIDKRNDKNDKKFRDDIEKISKGENKKIIIKELLLIFIKECYNYEDLVFKFRVALLVSRYVYVTDNTIIDWICSTRKPSISLLDKQECAMQILYDNIINKKETKNFQNYKIMQEYENSDCLFNCLNKLLLKDYKFTNTYYIRKLIVRGVYYLYENFDGFKYIFNYFYSNIEISDYKRIMEVPLSNGGNVIEIIAACHIFNADISMLHLSDDKLQPLPIKIPTSSGKYDIKDVLSPIYFDDNILKVDLFCEERPNYQLFYVGHSDNFDSPYFNYFENNQKIPDEIQVNINKIKIKLLDYTTYSMNCLKNPDITCQGNSVCDLRTEKCANVTVKDYRLQKFKDDKGNVFVGYESDIQKYKVIKGIKN